MDVKLVEADSRLACATLSYRWHGKLHLGIVAKGTFELVPGGAMSETKPEPLYARDSFFDDDPRRSVEWPSDLVPLREKVDVTVLGHAYAPMGRPASATTAQLIVTRDGRALVNKTVLVEGERGEDGVPRPFERVPLRYEQAKGERGDSHNPVGVPGGNTVVGSGAPGSFGPIASAWPRRLGLIDAGWQARFAQPVAELGDGLPTAYFQAAPADQQLDELAGGEWITLAGMHRGRPQLKTEVPKAHVLAWLSNASGAMMGVELKADALHVDADRQIATITWRSNVAIDEQAKERIDLRISMFVEGGEDGAPVEDEDASATAELPRDALSRTSEGAVAEWPVMPFELAGHAYAPPPSSKKTRVPSGTGEYVPRGGEPTLPFDEKKPKKPPGPPPKRRKPK